MRPIEICCCPADGDHQNVCIGAGSGRVLHPQDAVLCSFHRVERLAIFLSYVRFLLRATIEKKSSVSLSGKEGELSSEHTLLRRQWLWCIPSLNWLVGILPVLGLNLPVLGGYPYAHPVFLSVSRPDRSKRLAAYVFSRCFNLALLNRKIFDVDGDEVSIHTACLQGAVGDHNHASCMRRQRRRRKQQ